MSIKKKRSRLYQSSEQETEPILPQDGGGTQQSRRTQERPRSSEAREIVKRYAYYSSGVGLVPVPVAEVLTVNAVQYAMIKKLAACYNIPFKEHRVKSLLSSLLSGVVSASIIYGPVTNALTFLTGIGWMLKAGIALGVSGTVTMALGKLFIDHFERGGTFLDLDVEHAKLLLNAEHS